MDSINIQGSIARYVTKYSMKSKGVDDTFQLFSHGIGIQYLLDTFNGRPYLINGREYSVPRLVWNAYILKTYNGKGRFENCPMTSTYRRPDSPGYDDYVVAKRFFLDARNNDPLYLSYVSRQRSRADLYDSLKPSDEVRVCNLDNNKYFAYKSAWFARWRCCQGRVRVGSKAISEDKRV